MNKDDLISSDLLSKEEIFNAHQHQVIAAIAGAMIGQDDAMNLPAASDPRIMVTIMGKAAHFTARIIDGIEALQAEIDPLAVPSEVLIALLDKDPRFRSISMMLTIVVMQSYYQDPRVLAAHGLSSRPPFPIGHEVESGDWSLLDPVKKRGSLYRLV